MSKQKFAFTALLPGILASMMGCAVVTSGPDLSDLPANTPGVIMSPEIMLAEWLVVGPFPETTSDVLMEDGTYSIGYSYDFLNDAGGESNVHFSTTSTFQQNGQILSPRLIEANQLGIVDLGTLFQGLENHIAYGYSVVVSPVAQTVYCLLGSDDAVKLWINGVQVHANYTFRGVNPGEDRFPVQLKKGPNHILIKVLNGVRGWGYSVSMLDQAKWAEREANEAARREMEAFANLEIVPDWYNFWDESFNPGPFPALRWTQPMLAQRVLVDEPFTVRWFNTDLEEVTEASSPGRYGYVIETQTKGGRPVRRAGSVYCYPWEWMGWSDRFVARLEPPAAARFDADKLALHQAAIDREVGRILLLSTLDQKEGARLFAFLHEIDHDFYQEDEFITPLVADKEFHLRLQEKIGGVKYTGPGLAPPAVRQIPAKTLRDGTAEEAGFNPAIVNELESLCQTWFEKSQEPFVTLVARNGIIVYHQATGSDATEVFTTQTVTPMASTTKLITGVTFGQFVQQGLIGIDDPLGSIFPDFPLTGPQAITLRHCFTHTSGLVGHERWGGVHNPRLENTVSNQLDFLEIGLTSTYNGDGYNLAGRVMEAISRKSIFRVISENLFIPLGMETTVMEEDLAFSMNGTAEDLAKVGQMLLNEGSYGQYEFFSPDVFESLLPTNLSAFYPGMNWDQGIGITWMNNQHPQAGQNGNPTDLTILSKRTIGHGSATSVILRVDLDQSIVLTQSRRQAGPHYDKYLNELLLTIARNIE